MDTNQSEVIPYTDDSIKQKSFTATIDLTNLNILIVLKLDLKKVGEKVFGGQREPCNRSLQTLPFASAPHSLASVFFVVEYGELFNTDEDRHLSGFMSKAHFYTML